MTDYHPDFDLFAGPREYGHRDPLAVARGFLAAALSRCDPASDAALEICAAWAALDDPGLPPGHLEVDIPAEFPPDVILATARAVLHAAILLEPPRLAPGRGAARSTRVKQAKPSTASMSRQGELRPIVLRRRWPREGALLMANRQPTRSGFKRWRAVGSVWVHGDPIIATGVSISVGIAVALALTDYATPGEAFVAGLVGVNLTVVIDSISRSERRFYLRNSMEMAAWLPEAFVRTTEAMKKLIRGYGGGAIEEEARRLFEEFASDLETLERGRYTRPGNDYSDLIKAVDRAEVRIIAVTSVAHNSADDPSWWDSPVGRSYWSANIRARERGVQIDRIFVCDSREPKMSRLLDEHLAAGVKVLVAQRQAASALALTNFAVIDDEVAWEAVMNPQGSIARNQYSLNPSDIARLNRAFAVAQFSSAPHSPPQRSVQSADPDPLSERDRNE